GGSHAARRWVSTSGGAYQRGRVVADIGVDLAYQRPRAAPLGRVVGVARKRPRTGGERRERRLPRFEEAWLPRDHEPALTRLEVDQQCQQAVGRAQLGPRLARRVSR